MRKLYRSLIALVVLFSLAFIVRADVITPADTSPTASDPLIWGEANVRADANVSIAATQPRDGDASLELSFSYVTNGQDKADFEVFWDPIAYPERTLGNLQDIQYDWYVDSTTTGIAAHLAPVLRLYYLTTSGERGLLIYEQVYNGYSPSVPTDVWQTDSIIGANFWMRAFGPGRTINNYSVTLNDWMTSTTPIFDWVADPDPAHILSNDTFVVGVNVGIGSGWGNSAGDQFLGYVDKVAVDFGSDDIIEANFEIEPAFGSSPVPGSTIDIVTDADTNGNFNIEVFETGSASLQIEDIRLSGDTQIGLNSPTSFTINDGEAAQLINKICDASAAGSYTTTVSIDYNSPASPATYTVNCTVSAAALPPAPPPVPTSPPEVEIVPPEELGVAQLPSTGQTPAWAHAIRQILTRTKTLTHIW